MLQSQLICKPRISLTQTPKIAYSMVRDLFLAIDVGTGGIRSALVDHDGKILKICHKEHEQIVPRYGWSEQRPMDWWAGTVETINQVLAKVDNAPERVAAICACGQMHGAVLVDSNGLLTRETAPLWNDKRTQPQVDQLNKLIQPNDALRLTANLPSPAWPASKLMWLMENDPEAVTKAESLLMPKDWINLKLTGECAQDYTEASLSFLMDQSTRDWSDELIALTGIPGNLLSPIRNPSEILGGLTATAANHLGLSTGIPVLVGAGDYPTALLGSGVCGAGMGSDVTGTSTIMTLIHKDPVMHPNVSNLLEPSGSWGSFTLLDAGGDAMRWARRAFHENRRSYGEVADAAIRAQAGSNSLFFLPYLNGERFSNAPNSRAQFFGLTSGHGLAELHRSILEGVAFSVRLRLDLLQGSAGRPERFVASSGGAKSRLWLEIKASMYNTPYVVPEELECGVVGAAILMAHATGKFANLRSASRHMVQLGDQINPNPEWCDLYDRMMPIYSDLYHTSQQFYDRIDRL